MTGLGDSISAAVEELFIVKKLGLFCITILNIGLSRYNLPSVKPILKNNFST